MAIGDSWTEGTPADVLRLPPSVEGPATLTLLEKAWLGQWLGLVAPRVVVELGVWQAHTTRFMADTLLLNDIGGVIHGFDLPHVVEGLESEDGLRDHLSSRRVILHAGRLPATLERWLTSHDDDVDLALVDAKHDYASVSAELALIWPRLASDGVVLCHDYSEKHEGVRYAVDRFSRRSGALLMPLHASGRTHERQGGCVLVALRKPPFPYDTGRLLHHRLQALRGRLLAWKPFRVVWEGTLRGLIKRDRGEPST